MKSKEITEIKLKMLHSENWKNENSKERKLYEEMCLREMVMSCLTYGESIFTSKVMNFCSEYYGEPYINEYIDILGKKRALQVAKEQEEYFKNSCKVIHNVGTDYDGITYNSLVEN